MVTDTAETVAEKVENLVNNHNFEKLRRDFPDARALAKATNHFNFDNNSDSLLSIVVKKSDAPFLNKLIHAYFSDYSEEIKKLKFEFLTGITSACEKMNYHYFRDYLPDDIVNKTDAAYGITTPKNIGISAAEKERMSKLYRLIKQQRLELEAITAPKCFEFYEFDIIRLSSDEKPVHEAELSGGGVVNLERDYPIIAFCNVPMLTVAKDRVVAFNLNKHHKNKKASLPERIYKQSDYPEDFIKQAKVLDVIEKDWELLMEDKYLRQTGLSFINNGGIIRIDGGHNYRRTNKIGGYSGYMGNTVNNRPFAAIHADDLKKGGGNTLIHEITHTADLLNGEIMSQSILVCYAFALTSADLNKNGLRKYIFDRISIGYDSQDYCREFMANIMQYARKDTKSGYPNDRLLRNMYKLFGKFSEAKRKNNFAVIRRINTMHRRIKHASDYNVLYLKIQNYLLAIREYGMKKKSYGDVIKEEKNFREAISKSRFRPEYFQKTENEFCENLISELRKINQISEDRDALKMAIPENLLDIKTNDAVEIIFAKAGRDYVSAYYMLPREHMQKSVDMYEYLEKNIHKYTNKPEDFNDKCLSLLAYANKTTRGKILEDFQAKDFGNPKNLILKIKQKLVEHGAVINTDNSDNTLFNRIFKKGMKR